MKTLIKLLPILLLIISVSVTVVEVSGKTNALPENPCSINHYPVNDGKTRRFVEFAKGGSKERTVVQSLQDNGMNFGETITYPNEVTIIRRKLECVPQGIRMMDMGNLLAGSHTQLRVTGVTGLSLKKGEWRVGDTWKSSHNLAGTNNPLIDTLSINGTATSVNKVMALDEKVEVVGGTFTASRVLVVTKVRFLVDKKSPNDKSIPKKLPINATSSHWYAPGIGLIKSVIKTTFGDTRLEYLGEKRSNDQSNKNTKTSIKKGYPPKTLPGAGSVSTKPDQRTICIIPAETNLVSASNKREATKAIYLAFESMLRPASYKAFDLGKEDAYRAKQLATKIGCHFTMNLELKRVREDVAKLVSKGIDDSEKALANSSSGYQVGSSPGYESAVIELRALRTTISTDDIFSLQFEITNSKGKRILKGMGFSKARLSGDSKLAPLVEKTVREIRRAVFKETL